MRASSAARWLLAAALLALGLAKLLAEPRPPFEIMLLAALLGSRPMTWLAALVEIVLGLGMATKWRGAATRGVVVWLTILTGLLLAFVVGGIPLGGCGCFGSRHASLSSRVAVLTGLWLLTSIAGARVRVDRQLSVGK